MQSSIHCNLASIPPSFVSLLIRVTSHLIIIKSSNHVDVSVTFCNRWPHLYSSVKGPCNATAWLFLASSPISSVTLSFVLFLSLLFGLSHPCQSLNSVVFNLGWPLESPRQYLKNTNAWDTPSETLVQWDWEGTQAAFFFKLPKWC